MNIWLLIIIGISLSMDTFSLSLAIGTFKVNNKKILIYSLIVGIFHFIMPIIGNILGNTISKFIYLNPNRLLFIIFLFLGVEMFVDLFNKNDKEYNLKIYNMFIYAISVSIDSLTLGIGLNNITNVPLLGSIIFSILSFIFTFIGLKIGNYTNKKLGNYSKIIGIIIILILAFIHLIK